ncbi:MAG: glycosyltransferase family 2 protein [Elusimicrobia bacterium]|nr:glycosyltransferase family 2 protein [Elusimicrobiota bacterium]
MAKISVSVIGHNEERSLVRCLESVKWADDLVYVDCGSSDLSVEVASHHKARVFRRENDFNINVNKQFGLEQCSGDWILYLDPDEEVPPGLAAELKTRAAGKDDFSAFYIPRRNFYFGRWLKRGGKYPDLQLRFFKKGAAAFPCKNIHEKLEVKGRIGETENAFDHYPCKDVDDLLGKMGSYSMRKSLEYKRSGSMPGLLKPFRRFVANYILKAGFLDGWEGLTAALADVMNECLAWLKYKEKSGL